MRVSGTVRTSTFKVTRRHEKSRTVNFNWRLYLYTDALYLAQSLSTVRNSFSIYVVETLFYIINNITKMSNETKDSTYFYHNSFQEEKIMMIEIMRSRDKPVMMMMIVVKIKYCTSTSFTWTSSDVFFVRN